MHIYSLNMNDKKELVSHANALLLEYDPGFRSGLLSR